MIKVRSKAWSTSSKWHIMMKHYFVLFTWFMQPCPWYWHTLYCGLRQVALILQMAAIGFWDSLPTAARWSVNMFIYSCLLNDKFVIPCLFHAIRKISMVGHCITFCLWPHVIRHPTIDIFPYYVNKQGITNSILLSSFNIECICRYTFIIPVSQLDANIKGAAHPGWYRTMSVTVYGVILGQWAREVCVSYAQHPRT